jgi:hypothetical protein
MNLIRMGTMNKEQERAQILRKTEERTRFKCVSVELIKGGVMPFLTRPSDPYLVMFATDGKTPLYGFKIKAKKNEIHSLFRAEASRGGVLPKGPTFEQTQYDYNGSYE